MSIQKKQIYLIHSWAGILAGIGLLILSVTGSVLCFKEELEPIVYPELYAFEGAQPIQTYDVLYKEATAKYTDYFLLRIYPPTYSNETYKAYMFKKDNIEEEIHIYYTKAGWQQLPDRWLHVVEDLHIYLLMTRYTGMVFNFILSFSLVCVSITGFWIYRKSIYKILSFNSKFELKSLVNWHNNIGLLSLAFCSLMGTTALIITFPSAFSGPIKPSILQIEAINYNIDMMLAKSISYKSDSTERLNNITLLKDKIQFHYNTPTYKNGAIGEFTRVLLDTKTGEKIKLSGKSETELMKALNSCVSFHFGNFGGWTTKIIYSLSGIFVSILVISGGLLYFKRTKKISWNKKIDIEKPIVGSAKKRFIQVLKYWMVIYISFFSIGLLFGLFMGQPIKSGLYLTVLLLFPFILNLIFLVLFLLMYHIIRLIRRKKTTQFISAYSSLSLYFFTPTFVWYVIMYFLPNIHF
ncbi:PepSY-associated TM helix domain-containing protein [uncultured Cytophaga sp.]|uniref:PepSY-associated TM helix domain-containing protein n=1 Tax=uncultured Cytophaga sp. TaxID=160238 RepID=UPI002607E83D|nr:PepSY-associated TM helix domain-containing protein [uncultured Cytophaga sp.]